MEKNVKWGCNLWKVWYYIIRKKEREEMKEIKVYQTNNREYVFMNYEFAMKHNFDFKDYKEVASFMGNYEDLEYIFQIGNNGYLTSKYQMRSISVSDIIQVDNKYYFVDSFGFKELQVL